MIRCVSFAESAAAGQAAGTSQTFDSIPPMAFDQESGMKDTNISKNQQDKTKTVLNLDEENEITAIGFKLVRWKWFLTTLAMFGSAGLLWLLLYWIPKWKLWWTHVRVALDKADTVLIEDEYKKDYKRYYVEKIYNLQNHPEESKPIKIPLPDPKGGNAFRQVDNLR